jgi:thiol-disulfide isomerase/thioredoxin
LDEQQAADLTHQNLAPIYEELADAFVHAKDKVVIAKVDADGEGKPLGKKYGVTGYPSENQSWCSCLMLTEHSFFQLSCGSTVKATKPNTQMVVTLTA